MVTRSSACPSAFGLSLHDALPICCDAPGQPHETALAGVVETTIFAGASHVALVRLGGGELAPVRRSEEHTSELQSQSKLVCRLLLEKKIHVGRRWDDERRRMVGSA